MEGFISIYFYIGLTIIGAGLLIHTFVVVRVLRSHGHGRLTGWINIMQVREQAEYKKICIAEGKPLIWWRILTVLNVLSVVFVLGWFALMYFS
jgi:hypothetical protein